MVANNMPNQQPTNVSRFDRISNALLESLKQIKLSIEKNDSKLSPSMLRKQTLANVNVILALYRDGHPLGQSAPTIIVAHDNKEKQVYAAVVRTQYIAALEMTEMTTVIQGPSCSSDVQALEGLYKLSRSAVQRAKLMSMNPQGFDDWDDLDLP